MFRAKRTTRALLAAIHFAVLLQPAAAQSPETREICGESFIAEDERLQTVCDLGYEDGTVAGPLTGDALAGALDFPHWQPAPTGSDAAPPPRDISAQLPALDGPICGPSQSAIPAAAVAQFMASLAARPPAEQPQTLRLIDMRIDGHLAAPAVPLTYGIAFKNVVFCGTVDFSGAELSRTLSFEDSVFAAGPGETAEGIFRGQSLRSALDVQIFRSRVGAVFLPDAQANRIDITETALGYVYAEDAQAQNFSLHNTRQYNGIAERVGAWLEELSPAQREINLGESFPAAFFAGYIDLGGLAVGDLFYSDRLVVDGALAALDADIRRVRLREAVLPAVDFRRLRADRVELYGAQIGQETNRDTCDIDRAFRFGVDFVSFQNARVSTAFLLHPQPPGLNDEPGDHSVARGTICLHEMQIGGDLDLSALDAQRLKLRRTNVGGTLAFASEAYGAARFSQPESLLDMRGVGADAIALSADIGLPTEIRMARSTLGTYSFSEMPDANLGNSALLSLLTRLLIRIDVMEERRIAYSVFEETLGQAGQEIALAELIFLRERTLTQSLDFGLRRIARTIAEILSGYGTRPERTVGVAAVATVLGALVVWRSTEGWWFLMRQALSQEGPRPSNILRRRAMASRHGRKKSYVFRVRLWPWLIFDTLVLSLDRLIPLVSISDPHKKLTFRRQRWVRVYFVFHSLLGFLLAGTVVATVSKSVGL